jgi:hypothetical protein
MYSHQSLTQTPPICPPEWPRYGFHLYLTGFQVDAPGFAIEFLSIMLLHLWTVGRCGSVALGISKYELDLSRGICLCALSSFEGGALSDSVAYVTADSTLVSLLNVLSVALLSKVFVRVGGQGWDGSVAVLKLGASPYLNGISLLNVLAYAFLLC